MEEIQREKRGRNKSTGKIVSIKFYVAISCIYILMVSKYIISPSLIAMKHVKFNKINSYLFESRGSVAAEASLNHEKWHLYGAQLDRNK